jgi:hypothetical protein
VSNIETDMQLVTAGFCPCENRVREVGARARACVPNNHPTLYHEVCYDIERFVVVSSVPQNFISEERAVLGFETPCF